MSTETKPVTSVSDEEKSADEIAAEFIAAGLAKPKEGADEITETPPVVAVPPAPTGRRKKQLREFAPEPPPAPAPPPVSAAVSRTTALEIEAGRRALARAQGKPVPTPE